MSVHKVFVYGTLKKGEYNSYILQNEDLGRAEFIGLAVTVDKWPLVISGRFNIPYLLYKHGTGKQITGEVHVVDDRMLATLDQLEGHPGYYERDLMKVKLTNSSAEECTCSVYFMKRYRPEILQNCMEADLLADYHDQENKKYIPPKHRPEAERLISRYDVMFKEETEINLA